VSKSVVSKYRWTAEEPQAGSWRPVSLLATANLRCRPAVSQTYSQTSQAEPTYLNCTASNTHRHTAYINEILHLSSAQVMNIFNALYNNQVYFVQIIPILCMIIPAVNAHTRSAELSHIAVWAQYNNLKLNLAKSQEIIFVVKRKISCPSQNVRTPACRGH